MSRRLKQAAVILVVDVAAAQLLRPARGYPPADKLLLAVSCDDVMNGRVPGPYSALHPETKLSARDVETICTAARQPQARAPAGL